MDGPRSNWDNFLSQRQLVFPDLDPLSDADRAAQFLAYNPPADDSEYIEISLATEDDRARTGRARRYLATRWAQYPYDTDWGHLITGGNEAAWLYREAQWSYIHELYLASLLCSHAACERCLAGNLRAFAEDLPTKWSMWGLGALTKESHKRGLIDDQLRYRLDHLSELRKVTAHYRDMLEPSSLMNRAISMNPEGLSVEDIAAAHGLAGADAMAAFGLATDLLLGPYGLIGRGFVGRGGPSPKPPAEPVVD